MCTRWYVTCGNRPLKNKLRRSKREKRLIREEPCGDAVREAMRSTTRFYISKSYIEKKLLPKESFYTRPLLATPAFYSLVKGNTISDFN